MGKSVIGFAYYILHLSALHDFKKLFVSYSYPSRCYNFAIFLAYFKVRNMLNSSADVHMDLVFVLKW